MLLRHPDIYVQATMNNLYGYFYPGGFTTKLYSYDNSETHLEELNESLADDGVSFHYPAAFDAVRRILKRFGNPYSSFQVWYCSIIQQPISGC